MRSEVDQWQHIKRARRIVLGLFLLFPFYAFLTSHFLGDGFLWVGAMLPYLAVWLFMGFRLYFSVKCPVCGKPFFAKWYGNPFALRCMNCGAKPDTNSSASP